MFCRILGKRWNLRFTPLKINRGECDAPATPRKQIRIDSRLQDQEQLEVILHELMHAANWSLDEDHITATGKDFAAILWRLGYRKTERATGQGMANP